MIKRMKRYLAILMAVAIGIGFYATPAQASELLKSASVTLGTPKAGTGSTYTFSAKVKSGPIKGIRMAFRTAASGSTQNPTAMNLATAAWDGTYAGIAGIADGDWTIDDTQAASGNIYLKNNAGTALNDGDTISWRISSITNPPITNSDNSGCQQNSTNASAGTCFVKIQTFNTDVVADMNTQGDSATPTAILLDETTVAFTVVAEITVSARVDSTLSFTVVGVNQGTTTATAGATTATAATTDYNNLPFGNLSVGTPKTLSQKLYVKTNAYNGYSVKIKSTSSNPLNGVYSAPTQNKIDPFDNNNTFDGGNTAPNWTAPQAWAAPTTTTANNHSGYIGVSTSDTDVWAGTAKTGAGSNKWAPLNSTANELMKSTGPDLGAEANVVQITFAIEVNVYQPADSYTGTIQYNCVPTY